MAPTQGRIVLVGISETCVRPAMVVGVNTPGVEDSTLQLQVFLDGMNDSRIPSSHNPDFPMFTTEECVRGIAWRTSVPKGDGIEQWRWPPRVLDTSVDAPPKA